MFTDICTNIGVEHWSSRYVLASTTATTNRLRESTSAAYC
jgi:hypothetical protein